MKQIINIAPGTLYSVITYMGEELKKNEDMYMYN